MSSETPSSISAGTLRVYTYKEGLLSKVAHDLQLTLERFEYTITADAVEARFWPATLRVDGAVRDGRLDSGALSEANRREIHGNITDKILHTARFPEATLRGTRAGDRVTGQLVLRGASAPVALTLSERDGRLRGRCALQPSAWGIPPFKALFGAIKLRDHVEIEWDLPHP